MSGKRYKDEDNENENLENDLDEENEKAIDRSKSERNEKNIDSSINEINAHEKNIEQEKRKEEVINSDNDERKKIEDSLKKLEKAEKLENKKVPDEELEASMRRMRDDMKGYKGLTDEDKKVKPVYDIKDRSLEKIDGENKKSNNEKRANGDRKISKNFDNGSGKIDPKTGKRKNKYDIKYVNPSKHKVLKVIGIILIIIVVIVAAICGAGYAFLNGKMAKTDFEEIDKNDVGIDDETKDAMKDFRNIAILGVDARYDDYDIMSRTDCIIIASINQKTNDVTLWSIYRDTYVQMELDGVTKLNKINQAYYNGVQNTIKTINENLDLNITEYALADFNAVRDLIDEIGGIDLNITSDELKYINGYIDDVTRVSNNTTYANHKHLTSPGTQHVDGTIAMAYCRIRYTTGGDYKRTERMRTVLQKTVDKIKTKNVTEINGLVNDIAPKIRTNIKTNEIVSLIPTLLSMDTKESFGWPYKTTGVWMKNEQGNNDFYGPADTLESNVLQLHQQVFDQTDYVVPDSIKEISNKIIEKTGVGKSK